MASDEVIWGALDRMRLALSEDGEKPAWLPHPTLSAPPPSSPPAPREFWRKQALLGVWKTGFE